MRRRGGKSSGASRTAERKPPQSAAELLKRYAAGERNWRKTYRGD